MSKFITQVLGESRLHSLSDDKALYLRVIEAYMKNNPTLRERPSVHDIKDDYLVHQADDRVTTLLGFRVSRMGWNEKLLSFKDTLDTVRTSSRGRQHF